MSQHHNDEFEDNNLSDLYKRGANEKPSDQLSHGIVNAAKQQAKLNQSGWNLIEYLMSIISSSRSLAFAAVMLFLGLVVVPASRVSLGVHSWAQVAAGAALGFAFGIVWMALFPLLFAFPPFAFVTRVVSDRRFPFPFGLYNSIGAVPGGVVR